MFRVGNVVGGVTIKPKFFRDRLGFRRWLERHHDTASEVWVGLYKKSTGKPSITWPEAVDEALCFGWIDGVRKSLGPDAYTNRFTPRKSPYWSAVNVRKAEELIELGLMRPPGLAAFEARKRERTGLYSYEQRPADLPDEYVRQLRKNRRAWEFWQRVAPSYRKAATWWIVGAKKEETRARRLATLIESSARGERVPPLRPPGSA
jgi:uncharacterized protein YdeI (YjbR/CyaY-like superfamily)